MHGTLPRILVVEDDHAICSLLAQALEMEGYAVTTALNGRIALDLLASQSFDLILLDVLMPEIDGWTFLEAYRERPLPHAPVVVTTTLEVHRFRAEALGAAAFLAKPFDLDTLLATVAMAVGSSYQPQQAQVP